MAKETCPAFQFYPKDFLADGNVAAMSLHEVGAYIKLLCYCWQEEAISANHQRLANMVGVSLVEFNENIWPALQPCFVEGDGLLRHKRLDAERQKQEEYRQKQSDRGKASAAARNHAATNHSTGHQPDYRQVQTGPQPKSNSPSPSPVSSICTTTKDASASRREYGRLFLHRWQLDSLIASLGPHVDHFDLDEWIVGLSETADRDGLVLEKKTVWPWVQSKLAEEVRLRGLPVARPVAAAETMLGKTNTRLMDAIGQLQG